MNLYLADNPFATSYENCDSMFNAINTIAGIVIDIGTRAGFNSADAQIRFFHQLVTTAVFTDKNPELTSPSYLWVTDVLWLVFGAIYPFRHTIDNVIAPPCVAKLCAAMAKHCKVQADNGHPPVGASFGSLLTSEELAEVRRLWSAFCQRPDHLCAWRRGLAPLLKLLIANNGSHNLSLEKIAAFRQAVDNIPRSAFLVYSPDGITPPQAPNPLQDCIGFDNVRRPHVDPVFFATGELLEIDPRGALVGVKQFQLRQAYIMLLGAHMKDVVPQVVRNEGGLSLRLSSAADILESTGELRTDKACAPLQTESDGAAFGTRDAKMYGAALQRSAWDKNSMALTPLFSAVNPPADKEKRQRGEFGDSQWLKHFIVQERDKFHTLDVEILARRRLISASALAAETADNWQL